MAIIKHRKLFLANEAANQTITCFSGDYCSPSYDDYFLPPPPHPQPQPPQKSTKHGGVNTMEITIAAALVGGFVLLILSYYLLVVKNCFGLIRRRPAQGPPEGENQDFLDENRGPVIDHPIWYIRTIGLQPSVINTITIFTYKLGEKLVEGTECSVCLNEFQEDETLRLLPKCNHAFHIRCIDTWLRSHTNCPLCRAPIVPNPAAPARNPNPNPGPGTELIVQTENRAQINGEQNNIEAGNRENIERFNDDEEEEEEEEEEAEVQESDEIGKMERTGNGNDDNVVYRSSTRRSLSVGSSIAANVVDLVERDEETCLGDPEASQSNSKSIAECLHKKPVLMKRSFSYAGRSFFSRHQPNTPQN